MDAVRGEIVRGVLVESRQERRRQDDRQVPGLVGGVQVQRTGGRVEVRAGHALVEVSAYRCVSVLVVRWGAGPVADVGPGGLGQQVAAPQLPPTGVVDGCWVLVEVLGEKADRGGQVGAGRGDFGE